MSADEKGCALFPWKAILIVGNGRRHSSHLKVLLSVLENMKQRRSKRKGSKGVIAIVGAKEREQMKSLLFYMSARHLHVSPNSTSY
jgi:hypothetical protein